MSVFTTVGTMISSISLLGSGMFLAFLALAFGLARAITKDSKYLPILLTTFLSMFSMILILDLKAGVYLAIASVLGTMAWFIPMFHNKRRNDLQGEQ